MKLWQHAEQIGKLIATEERLTGESADAHIKKLHSYILLYINYKKTGAKESTRNKCLTLIKFHASKCGYIF